MFYVQTNLRGTLRATLSVDRSKVQFVKRFSKIYRIFKKMYFDCYFVDPHKLTQTRVDHLALIASGHTAFF